MLIPLRDENPLRIIAFQCVTASIIWLCVTVFITQRLLGSGGEEVLMLGFGFIPAVVFDLRELAPQFVFIPEELTALTSLFLHGSWLHLLGNMLFLWVFGDNIEDAMGHWRFVFFYLACGAASALGHGLTHPESVSPLVGASGAIAGVMGAYLVLHPRVRMLILVFYRVPLYLPAYLVLTLWLGFQIFNILKATDDAVAWWAHVAGFVTGAVLIVPLRDPQLPLFDRGVKH